MRAGGLLLTLAALLALAAPADAARRPVVGIGDQKPAMFEDPRLPWLGIRHARYVVPWYVALDGPHGLERSYVDNWLLRARAAGVRPVVSFGHAFSGPLRPHLPTRAEFRRAARAFVRRFPWVREYIAWNEANHCSQPTCKRPARAAAYFDELVRACRRCVVAAPAVLDQPNAVAWLRRFDRAARHVPRVYALHNYVDVNRLRSTGTRRVVHSLPRTARVWIAETGGVVHRAHYAGKADFPEDVTHAGKVTRFALRLARRFRKVERIYLFHWNIDRADPRWDSGLINRFGTPRPGFEALARFLGRSPRAAPPLSRPLPVTPAGAPPVTGGEPPAGAGSPPPPPPEEGPSASQDPSPPQLAQAPACGLPVCAPQP